MSLHGGVQTPGALPLSPDSASVEFEWQYRTSGGLNLANDEDIKRFFHPGSRRDKKVFDLAPRYEFAIKKWNPGNGLLREVLENISEFTAQKGARLPFDGVQIGSHAGTISSISAETYPADSLLIRITARFSLEFQKADFSSFYASLLELRAPKKLEVIEAIHSTLLGHLTEGDSHPRKPSVKFACSIRLPVDDAQYRRGAKRSRQALAAFHIGAQKAQEISPSLVDDIEERCQSLNLKSNTETMIANAQGVTYVIPTYGHTTPHDERFRKAADLLSIATYCQDALLDYDNLQNAKPVSWLKQARIARRWIEFPGNTFHSSVGNRELWNVLVNSLHLDSLVKELATLNEIRWKS